MDEKDDYCWFCHANRVKLPCKFCFRNYHVNCVNNIVKSNKSLIIANRNTGYEEFEDRCPECIMLSETARKWDSGQLFERIPKETLNPLLLAVWKSLKENAPEPFLWPASKFTDCSIKIDTNKMEQKAERNEYTNPRQFLCDLEHINHNCACIVRNENLVSGLKAKLSSYKHDMLDFRKIAKIQIKYIEYCPHCILARFSHPEIWLTMACPWGHPLILVNYRDTRCPAKLIKYNRISGHVDIILFGTGKRGRVCEKQCWLPCLSDMDYKGDSNLEMAYQQAKKYISTLEKKFGRKFRLPKETKALKAMDEDFICKWDSQNDDIILWSENTPSTPDERVKKDRTKTGVYSHVRDDAEKVTSSAEMNATLGIDLNHTEWCHNAVIDNDKDLKGPSPKKIKLDSSSDIQILKERLIRAEEGKEHQQELINGYQSQIKLLEKIDEENQKSLLSLKETCANLEKEKEKLKMQLSDEQLKTEMLGKNVEIEGGWESKLKRLTDNFDYLRSSIIAFLEIANLDEDFENTLDQSNRNRSNGQRNLRKK